jgi:tripartite-type tricarboxylate transporter receptor subunit TctC
MVRKRRKPLSPGRLLLLLLGGVLFPTPLFSQQAFYEGKTVRLIHGSEAGGTGDLMVRAALPFLKKHIPGEPTIVVEYMPGGGGIKAVNYVYRSAPPDGLTIGAVGGALIANAILGQPGVLYDIDRLIYLGSPHSSYHWIFMSRSEAGLHSQEKLLAAAGLRVGAQSVGHAVYIVGRLFSYLLGLREPKFVVGYSGPELDLALLRGEIDARINNADTLLKRNPDWLAKRLVHLHALMEVPKGNKHRHFDRLPEIEEFARNEKERKVVTLQRNFRAVGSPYFLAPGVPKERVEILKEAFRRTFKDPAFHREYQKLVGDEATPLLPEEQEKAVREIPRDSETIALFKAIAGGGPLPPR